MQAEVTKSYSIFQVNFILCSIREKTLTDLFQLFYLKNFYINIKRHVSSNHKLLTRQ